MRLVGGAPAGGSRQETGARCNLPALCGDGGAGEGGPAASTCTLDPQGDPDELLAQISVEGGELVQRVAPPPNAGLTGDLPLRISVGQAVCAGVLDVRYAAMTGSNHVSSYLETSVNVTDAVSSGGAALRCPR